MSSYPDSTASNGDGSTCRSEGSEASAHLQFHDASQIAYLARFCCRVMCKGIAKYTKGSFKRQQIHCTK